MAIETCVERSVRSMRTMRTGLGKSEDHQEQPASSLQANHSIEHRDIESERSERSERTSVLNAVGEGEREDTDLQSQEQNRLLVQSQEPNGDEEEFEMVLAVEKSSSDTEATVEARSFDEQNSTSSREGREDGTEENIVVWSAEEAGIHTNSRTMDSDADEVNPVEDGGVPNMPPASTGELFAANSNFEISFDDDDEMNHRKTIDEILAESYESPAPLPQQMPKPLEELSQSDSCILESRSTEADLDKMPSAATVSSAEETHKEIEDPEQVTESALGQILEATDESSESLDGPSIEWESDEERSKGAKQGGDAEERTTVKVESSASLESDKATPHSLSALINQRDWDQIIERVKGFSSLSEESIEEQASLLGRDSLGNSFLHEICKNDPSVEVIQVWLEFNKEDVERPGIGGHLPLHFACAFGASMDVVEILIEAFPESLATPDSNDKMLPLHVACRDGTSTEVLDLLMVAYPEATLVQDKHGMTPLDYAVNLKDPLPRQLTVNSIQKGLKNNLAALSNAVDTTKEMLHREQEKVKELESLAEIEKGARELQAKDDREQLEYALNRVAILEKADLQKNQEIDKLTQKTEALESQLEEAAENKRIYLEETRELESALKMEKCKNSALEQSLVAKQEMMEHEKERTRDAEERLSEMRVLLQNEKLKSKRLGENLNTEQEKSHRLQATKIAEEVEKLGDRPGTTTVVGAEIEVETAQKATLQQLRTENKAMMDENEETIRALESSNAKKQEMLAAQQEKVEALERVGREKEYLLQKNQEIMKALEESIERKLSLQKTEEEKIRQLDTLRRKKREMIESEEEQVRKLDYTLGRKQALLELEQMKEKTLQQTIAQKKALLETERSKVKELESRCSEKETLLVSEQNMVKSLTVSKKEKENLLNAERELVNELYRMHSEKEVLLEKKRKALEEITMVIEELEEKVDSEKDLLTRAARVRAEKEASLHAADETLKTIEERLTKQSSLLSKEQSITESLETFKERRREIASSGSLYALVDTTLSISHLVKEALLAKQHNQRLLEGQKSTRSAVVKNNPLPAPASILKRALSLKGRGYISHFAGFLGFQPGKRKYLR